MPDPYIEHSQTARSLLVLLNNISELITISQDRQSASEVLDCLEKYANSHSFPLPQQKVNNFRRVCIDSRPITLNAIVKDIALAVVNHDRQRQIEKNRLEKLEKMKDLKNK
jgi:hypothetical protein